ncbi:hypothetical protein U9M48_006250, partial [Paspalum notatum var. saurae]
VLSVCVSVVLSASMVATELKSLRAFSGGCSVGDAASGEKLESYVREALSRGRSNRRWGKPTGEPPMDFNVIFSFCGVP